MSCIMSHLGELSPTVLSTIELITRSYHVTVSKMYFEDGISLKRRAVQFRTRFKDVIMCVNVTGFGTRFLLLVTPVLAPLLSGCLGRYV